MKHILKILLISSVLFTAHASDKLYKCNSKGVCTETSTPISSLKTSGVAMSSGVKGKIGNGSSIGEFSTNQTICDTAGNCTTGAAINFNSGILSGSTNTNSSGSPDEGISENYTVQTSVDINCQGNKSYMISTGTAVRVTDCKVDTANNIYELYLSVCHKFMQKGGCERYKEPLLYPNAEAEDWSTRLQFRKYAPIVAGAQPWITHNTKPLDPTVTATVNCTAYQQKCTIDITAIVELSGSLADLAAQTVDGLTNSDNYLSGQRIAKRKNDDPSFQTLQAGVGQDMIDCAQDNLVGSADDGFLLSCDGSQRVTMAAECEEIVQCVQTQETTITYLETCETFVPIASQVCKVAMPYGSCEVFLETHDQICDTITPNGTCVYELENAVKVCDIHNPNGSCNAELVTDAMACIFNIPEGSCNVELLSSTTTCSNTVPNGDCSVQLDTFTKTCQVDVLEPLTCLMTANTEESTCTGTPNYDMKYCKYTRNIIDVACSITYSVTSSTSYSGYNCPLSGVNVPSPGTEYTICHPGGFEIRIDDGNGWHTKRWVTSDAGSHVAAGTAGPINWYSWTESMTWPGTIDCTGGTCTVTARGSTVLSGVRTQWQNEVQSLGVIENNTCD